MRPLRFSIFAGVIAVLVGYTPAVFGQSYDTSIGLTTVSFEAASSPIEKIHAPSNGEMATDLDQCTPRGQVIELGDLSSHTQVPKLGFFVDGAQSFVQLEAVPPCVLPADYTKKQFRRWRKCKKGLKCESYHGCFNEAGDEFASCKASDCE